MNFALKSDIRISADRSEETRVLPAGIFTELDDTDREILSDWLDRVSAYGIDTVIDLAARPWNIAGARVILGVFETNKDCAAWLIVQYGVKWTLARCVDGFVSDVSTSLPNILAMIELDRVLKR